MVMKHVNATYTETYDLNTAINELSLLAIHTPQAGALMRMFHGFFEQYKKYKINGCNIRMVCASQQALSPDLVGLEAGSVDPRDVLNPILFKACTGESINVLIDQIYNNSETLAASLGSNSIDQHVDNRSVAINTYYQLLSDDTWRKEHPQKGLNIVGLRPFVHKVVTTQPFKWTGIKTLDNSSVPEAPRINGPGDPAGSGFAIGFGSPRGSKGTSVIANPSVFVSDGMTDMPWLDTAVMTTDTVGNATDDDVIEPVQAIKGKIINSVPRVYMGCIVLPPAILQRLYFRLQVSWSVSFKDWRPAQDLGALGVYDFNLTDGVPLYTNSITDSTYWNMYHNATAKAELPTGDIGKEVSSFTTNVNAEVDKIMETAS